MCGRSSLTKSEKELEARFRATFYSDELEKYNPLPNYNVAPTHVMPVITNEDPEHFRPLRWGLIPFWAKDLRIGYKMINARKETVLEKSAFKNAVQKHRCIVPMDGYYEWKKVGKSKQPFRVVVRDQDIFSVAGLWAKWKSPEGVLYETYTILTQEPSPSIAHIHDRMPAILSRDQEVEWLDTDLSPSEALKILEPYPDSQIDAYTVSARVGKVTENDKGLIDPAQESDVQSTLF